MSEQSLKGKAVKGVAWNTINTVGTLGVNFIVGIILARILMPEDYGAVAMVGVFTSVLQIFTDGGLTNAIIRKEDRTEEDKCTIFYYNIITCYLLYGLLYLVAPWISSFYEMPILCDLTRIASITMLISPLASMQSVHFNINIDFKTPAFISIGCTAIQSIIALWMAFNGYGVWSLAVPPIFSTILRVILLVICVRWKPTKAFSIASFKVLFGYSNKLLASMLLDRIYNNITPLIVGKFFSPAQLGMYERARGWPTIPSQTITNVLQSVTFPVLSKMQNETERLANNYKRILKMSAFIIFPLMIGLASVAKPLTILLITDKWIDSVILMQLLCCSMMWFPIHAINLNLLMVIGRSDYFLKLEIIKKVWGLVVMGCSLPFGLVAFCAAGIASSFVVLFINTWYTVKIINVTFFSQMRWYIPILFNCLMMGGLCLFVQSFFDNNILKLVVSIFLGASYYIISSYFVSKEELLELMNILKRK